MKANRIIKLSGIFFLLSFLLCAFSLNRTQNSGSSDVRSSGEFPEEIEAVITNSCYDCHTIESQNKIAIFALDFRKWDEYKVTKKSQLLTKIGESVTEKRMPPKKYINNDPSKALTEEQIKLISQWSEKELSDFQE